jgi:SAM-dependent methyltransferase
MDLGSGQGDLLADLSRMDAWSGMLGVELSAVGVQIAARKVPTASFLQQDLLQPVPAACPYLGWADYAVCSEVLEHLDDPLSFLRNAAALMSPGCTLIVTVPGGPMSAFDRHIGHRKHYSVAELRSLLEQGGFSVKTVMAAGFPFFNLYRTTVILRGNALIQDVSSNPPTVVRIATYSMMWLFRALFAFNRTRGRRGWQIVAIAEWK